MLQASVACLNLCCVYFESGSRRVTAHADLDDRSATFDTAMFHDGTCTDTSFARSLSIKADRAVVALQ